MMLAFKNKIKKKTFIFFSWYKYKIGKEFLKLGDTRVESHILLKTQWLWTKHEYW